MAKFNPIKEGGVLVEEPFDPVAEGGVLEGSDGRSQQIADNVDNIFKASNDVQVNPFNFASDLQTMPVQIADPQDLPPEKVTDLTEPDNRKGIVESLTELDPVELLPFVGPGVTATRIVHDVAAMSRMAANPSPPKAMFKIDEAGSLESQDLMGQQIEWLKDKARVERLIEEMADKQRGQTIGGKIAVGVAQLPGFMIEFLATAGLFSSVKASTQKAITELLGRQGTRLAGRIVSKTAAVTVGSAARTALQASRVAAGTAQRLRPDIEVTFKGDILLKDANETPFTAFSKAFGDVLIENISEVSGPAISRLAQKTPFIGKFVKSLSKAFKKLHPDKGFVAEMITKGGYHGFLEELGEERVGGLLRAATGVEDFGKPGGGIIKNIVDSIPNAEELLVEAGIIAVPGVARSAANLLSTDKGPKVTTTLATPVAELKIDPDTKVKPEGPKKDAPVKPGQKTKERKFVTSVKELTPEIKAQGQYVPRGTDELSIKAKNLVDDNITEAETVALKGNSDTSVAVAAELIKKYSADAELAKTDVARDALYDKAARIANDTARKLTEAGRTVQAATILSRLTPEGQLRFAAREIQKYNEEVDRGRGGLFGLRKKIPELTPEQAKDLLKRMQDINNMKEGEDKAIAFHKFQRDVADLVPTPFFRKMVTLWKAGLLTGIKTSGLNIFSNVSHLATETLKDVPATMVDKIASLATGERTVAIGTKGIGKGLAEGAVKGSRYMRTGYDERDIGAKLDYIRVNFGKGKLAQALNKYVETVFHVLGAEDQPFYYAAKVRSMYEQAKVQAINAGLKGKEAQTFIDNLIENPTDDMVDNSSKDAEVAVYLNRTKLGDAAKKIQQTGVGEIIVPFARTPSAVAMQIVNYSPVGAVKTIIQNIGKGRFNQREFSQGMGRAAVGIAPLAIGAVLFKAGMMSLEFPKDEKERELQKAEGRKPNSILINGKWRTPASLGPIGNLLLIGGHFQSAFNTEGSPSAAMGKALSGSAKSFTEQTFLEGVSRFTDFITEPGRSAPYYIGGTLSSVIPTIVSDIARASDPKERQSVTIPERILSRIPVAREGLEPQIDILGRERTASGNPLELMIDPTRPSKDVSTDVVRELRRLMDEGYKVSPTKLGDKAGFESLTEKQNTELWKDAGKRTNDMLEYLIKTPAYESLGDKEKSTLIEGLVSAAKTAARMKVFTEQIGDKSGKEMLDAMIGLIESGVVNKNVLN